MKTENEQLIPYLKGRVAIKPEATTVVVAGYGEIPLVCVSAYLAETPVFHDDNTDRRSYAGELSMEFSCRCFADYADGSV